MPRSLYLRVTKVSDIPAEPHWAAVEETSVTIPGDERSRTNPGHGYPERVEQFVHYYVFRSEKDLKDWLLEVALSDRGSIMQRAPKIRAFHVDCRYTIKHTVEVV